MQGRPSRGTGAAAGSAADGIAGPLSLVTPARPLPSGGAGGEGLEARAPPDGVPRTGAPMQQGVAPQPAGAPPTGRLPVGPSAQTAGVANGTDANPYNDRIWPIELKRFALTAAIVLALVLAACFSLTAWATSRCRVRYGGPLGVPEGPLRVLVENFRTSVATPLLGREDLS